MSKLKSFWLSVAENNVECSAVVFYQGIKLSKNHKEKSVLITIRKIFTNFFLRDSHIIIYWFVYIARSFAELTTVRWFIGKGFVELLRQVNLTAKMMSIHPMEVVQKMRLRFQVSQDVP